MGSRGVLEDFMSIEVVVLSLWQQFNDRPILQKLPEATNFN